MKHSAILLGLISSVMAVSPAKADTITVGSDNFGATISSTYDNTLGANSYEAHLRTDADGKVLHRSIKLATGEVNFGVNPGNQTHAWGNLKIRGIPLASWDKRFNGNGSFTTAPFLKKDFAADQTFGLGPVNVKFRADATVSVSATGEIQYEWSRTHPPIIHAHNLGPVADAAVAAGLDVNLVVANAGIEGSLKLCQYAEYLNVDTMPRTGSGRPQLDVTYSAAFSSASTDGKIKLWAKAKGFLGRWLKKEVTIADYHGAPRMVMLASGTRHLVQ